MSERQKITLKASISPEKLAQIEHLKRTTSRFEARKRDAQAHQEKKQRVLQGLQWLEEQFPKCFNRGAPKPLKRGIEEDLLMNPKTQESITPSTLKNVLKKYVYQRQYQQALLLETWRYDLEGNAVEKIEDKHKEFAQVWLDKLKAQQQSQRPPAKGPRKGFFLRRGPQEVQRRPTTRFLQTPYFSHKA